MAMFAIPAAISIAGGIGGYFAGKKDREASEALSQAAYYQAMNLPMPPDLSAKITELKYVAEQMPESKLAQMVEDSGLGEMKNEALKAMQQRAKQGYTVEDVAASQQSQKEMNAANMAAQNALMQQAQMRGTANSNASLAAQLNAQQGAANQGADAAVQNAAEAAKRRGEALQQYSNSISQNRAQDLAFNQSKLGAADEFALKNYQNRQNVANENVGLQKAAIDAQGQYYDRLLGRAGSQIAATQGAAQQKAQEAAAKAGLWTGVGSGAGQMVGAGMSAYNANQANDLKERELKAKGY